MVNRELLPIVIDEDTPIYQRISWWIENTFVRVIKRAFNALQESIRSLVNFSLLDWFDELEDGLLNIIDPFIDDILEMEGVPESIRLMLTKTKQKESAASLIVMIVVIPLAMMLLRRAIDETIGETIAQLGRYATRPRIYTPGLAMEMLNREEIPYDQFEDHLRRGGWSNYAINAFLDLRHPHWDITELAEGYRRQTLEDGEVNERLAKMGFDDSFIRLWKENKRRIPSPAELVGIATREGFDDSVAARFGYDENLPEQAVSWAEKQGLDRHWFIKLWRAHWRLPGVAQGFEMFHRGILSQEELELLLRVSDIPSFWRNALIQLSYSVVTRVDVRRMYSLGVIDENGVYQRNLALGYSPSDARDLTDWTIASYAEKERELTKSDILGMYREGVLNEEETTGFLRALEYKTSDIILLVARQDLARQTEYETTVKKEVRLGYLAGIYDRSQVFGLLGQLDPPSGFIENALEIWDLEKRRRVKKPTVTNLRDFWLNDVISDVEIKQELTDLGYGDKYVQFYMSFWLKKYAGGE